jgi:hypothetical protein
VVYIGAYVTRRAILRFLAIDPVDGGSLNNYDYAAQDPINSYDLAGTRTEGNQDMSEDPCHWQACTDGTTESDWRAASPGTIAHRETGHGRRAVLRVAIDVGASVAVASCTGVCAGAIVAVLFALAAGGDAGAADYYLTPDNHTATGAFRATVTSGLIDNGAGCGLSKLLERMSASSGRKDLHTDLATGFRG